MATKKKKLCFRFLKIYNETVIIQEVSKGRKVMIRLSAIAALFFPDANITVSSA